MADFAENREDKTPLYFILFHLMNHLFSDFALSTLS